MGGVESGRGALARSNCGCCDSILDAGLVHGYLRSGSEQDECSTRTAPGLSCRPVPHGRKCQGAPQVMLAQNRTGWRGRSNVCMLYPCDTVRAVQQHGPDAADLTQQELQTQDRNWPHERSRVSSHGNRGGRRHGPAEMTRLARTTRFPPRPSPQEAIVAHAVPAGHLHRPPGGQASGAHLAGVPPELPVLDFRLAAVARALLPALAGPGVLCEDGGFVRLRVLRLLGAPPGCGGRGSLGLRLELTLLSSALVLHFRRRLDGRRPTRGRLDLSDGLGPVGVGSRCTCQACGTSPQGHNMGHPAWQVAYDCVSCNWLD